MTPAAGRILVGVDGTAASLSAVGWGATEARIREMQLLLVHVCTSPRSGGWTVPRIVREGLRESERPMMDAAVAYVRTHEPGVRVSYRIMVGLPSRTLLRLSSTAALTVVGRHHGGAMSSLLLGSATHELIAGCRSPLVLVAPRPDGVADGAARRVVVVDPGGASSAALRAAFEEAEHRQVPLRVIHAGSSSPTDAAAREPWSARVQRMTTQFPAVAWDDIRVEASAQDTTAACDARDLLVIGHRRHPILGVDRLSRWAEAVIRSAPCPIAIIREVP